MLIKDLPLPDVVKKVLQSRGISSLYPPQEEVVKKGLFSQENFVVSIPTASGKTLIAELAFLDTFLKNKGKTLYLVPLKALASEKLAEFKQWEDLNMLSVTQSTGDFDSGEPDLKNYDLIILTYEKLDSLLRHGVSWMEEVKTIIVDEIHLLNDPHRGPTLEVVLVRLKRMVPLARIIALSATIQNAREIAGWLDATLISSEWRPIPLHEGVMLENTIFFPEKKITLEVTDKDPLTNLVFNSLKQGFQVLIFSNTRRSAAKLARDLMHHAKKFLSLNEKKELQDICKALEKTGESSRFLQDLIQCTQNGSSFHHAGLNFSQRKIIETHFKKGFIKALCATPTLAIGVNLPARRVIITSYKRYDLDFGLRDIPVLEYKQFAGRAGRPFYDALGESVLISKSEMEKEFIFEKYILGKPEKIISKISRESVLRVHILSSIAMGFTKTDEELHAFINDTFFLFQHPDRDLEAQVDNIRSFLLENKFISRQKGKYHPTAFGRRVSQLYIDPLSAMLLKNGLDTMIRQKKTTSLGILHLICRTPDMDKRYLRGHEEEKYLQFVKNHSTDFLFDLMFNPADPLPSMNIPEPQFYSAKEMLEKEYASSQKIELCFVDEWFLREVKTACLLFDWINEKNEEYLMNTYGVQPGDLFRYVDRADWLLYSLEQFYRLFNFKTPKIKTLISSLRLRIKYGIKQELTDLILIKGIGRKRARTLFSRGIKSLEDLKKAPAKVLVSLPSFGPELIKSFGKQLEIDPKIINRMLEKNKKKKKSQQDLQGFL
ncbi:MAG: DEAD/DEAH box helicase [Candidatus Helarchaeota archaeon]